jgi:hypothetical protein
MRVEKMIMKTGIDLCCESEATTHWSSRAIVAPVVVL